MFDSNQIYFNIDYDVKVWKKVVHLFGRECRANYSVQSNRLL